MDKTNDFVTIDFETANEQRHSACAIGISVVTNGEIVETFSQLIRPPELRFAPFNTQVHGITEHDVRDAPTLDQLWMELLPRIDGRLVLAHNASFDISVLRHSLHAVSVQVPTLTYLCSLKLARCVWPNLVCHSLRYLADFFKIPLNHHDAGSDSRAAAELILLALESTNSPSINAMASKMEIQFGELISSEEWIPAVFPGLRRIRESLEIDVPENFDVTAHGFYEKTLVFTGKLSLFTRNEATRIVQRFGGFTSETVNEKTTYLVTGIQDARTLAKGATESSKLQKAKGMRERGIKIEIITEEDFVKMLSAPATMDFNK